MRVIDKKKQVLIFDVVHQYGMETDPNHSDCGALANSTQVSVEFDGDLQPFYFHKLAELAQAALIGKETT